MKVCGVELKGNDAIVCVMSLADGLYDLPQLRVAKVSIDDAGDAEQVQKFQFAFKKLMEDYQVEQVVIKGRALKGKFAGGPVGFKLEAAIQLIDTLKVDIVSGSFVKNTLAKSQVGIDFRDTGLKKFQQTAFETVFAFFEGK
ncbi:DUF3010 family protein [Thalassotalea euphylliae]|uniref:DUF3010 family protein n=1 Tax=Thalassotalea euphylliae TaxID=1655234 RepID=A0A3E0TNB2_9GAMM|nr:DUF3010 family protein [Thalassotalea euphylliae]REL25988.1 DUF3010 family protein [Thalassotalea euphylliae]